MGNGIDANMEMLSFLIGTWHTQGEVRGDYANPTITFKGTDSYEWILNGNFILHKVDVMMEEEKTEAIEIIGPFDMATKTYKMRSFDNQGTFTEMEAHIDKKSVLHIVGANMRSHLISHHQNKLIAHWERLTDHSKWVPWMELQLSK